MQTKPNDKIETNMFPAHRTTEEALGHGLTKREYFAAMALQGILAGTSGVESLASIGPSGWASVAVSHADALMAELNK